MIKKKIRHACIILLILSQSAAADISAILSNVAEAYGGLERIKSIVAYQQYGRTFSSRFNREGNLTRSYRYPDHLKVEINYDAVNSESRIIAGIKAWNRSSPANEMQYSSMLLQAARMGLPAILFEHRQHLEDAGMITGKEGMPLQALVLRFHGTNWINVGIDPDTGRILESYGVMQMNNMSMEFGTVYKDFRLQDGYLFPFKEEHYAMGNKTGYTNIQRIEIVPDLPAEIFQPSPLEKPDTVVKRSGSNSYSQGSENNYY